MNVFQTGVDQLEQRQEDTHTGTQLPVTWPKECGLSKRGGNKRF